MHFQKLVLELSLKSFSSFIVGRRILFQVIESLLRETYCARKDVNDVFRQV